MCRTHSATKTKIVFLKWWWTLIEKGHKVSESMPFSNFSRTFRNAEKSSKNNLNAWWETTGANKTYKAQPQPKANQKENEPKRWLIFWIGERWVKVIGERGEPKRWIRKFLNLQKLSDSWFLNCLPYQHLLPMQKLEIKKFLNLQKLSGVLLSRRWRLMSFHKRRAEFVAMPHIATYRISGTPLISIVYPRWNVRTILPVQWSISWPHKPC